jgi:5-methylcytosine-specific restriction enzyme A
MTPFVPGKVYRRVQDIHQHLGGQRQGGISTPSSHPYIFLFTGESGSSFGYKDDFRPDGTFWYTGEGQVGDMKMDRGNAAIKNHAADGKSLVLFEYVSNGRVRCVGDAIYLGHHIEQRPDRNGQIRNALVFELDVNSNRTAKEAASPETDNPNERTLRLWSRPLSEVRSLALDNASPTATEKSRRIITRQRSEAVRVYVLRRANGSCEACNQNAPFQTKAGRPYLEPHHIHRLADGGPDTPEFVAAICPNCHREIHHGVNGKSLNDRLTQLVQRREADR